MRGAVYSVQTTFGAASIDKSRLSAVVDSRETTISGRNLALVRAIETVYNHYRFRSRIEARWAVFFDALGIPYEYEKEGYELDGVGYLPDFWLPKQGYFIEIKGAVPTQEEHEKALKLAQQSGHKVALLEGEIPVPSKEAYTPFATVYRPSDASVWTFGPLYLWAECPHCRKIELLPEGILDEWASCDCLKTLFLAFDKNVETESITRLADESEEQFKAHTEWWLDKYREMIRGLDSPRLLAAYTVARQARFEYGESGGPRAMKRGGAS